MSHADIEKSQQIELVNGAAVPTGVVRLQANPDRQGSKWFLVSIGRARYVKRFNLSDAEARQLVDLLTRELGL